MLIARMNSARSLMDPKCSFVNTPIVETTTSVETGFLCTIRWEWLCCIHLGGTNKFANFILSRTIVWIAKLSNFISIPSARSVHLLKGTMKRNKDSNSEVARIHDQHLSHTGILKIEKRACPRQSDYNEWQFQEPLQLPTVLLSAWII